MTRSRMFEGGSYARARAHRKSLILSILTVLKGCLLLRTAKNLKNRGSQMPTRAHTREVRL